MLQFALNPDFAVEIVAGVLNAKLISVSGYFWVQKWSTILKSKNVLKSLAPKYLEAAADFQLQNPG